MTPTAVVCWGRTRGPTMKTYTVTLPDEFAEMVDRWLAAGKFASADHLMLYAVGLLDNDLAGDEGSDLERLRAEIAVARAQIDRGEARPLDVQKLRRRVDAELAADRETAHAPGDVVPSR